MKTYHVYEKSDRPHVMDSLDCWCEPTWVYRDDPVNFEFTRIVVHKVNKPIGDIISFKLKSPMT